MGRLSPSPLAALVLATAFAAALAQETEDITEDIAIGNIVGGDWPLTGT